MRIFPFFPMLRMLALALVLPCVFGAGHVQAQTPQAPEATATPATAPPIVELFSARICMFCPAAERLLGDLVDSGEVLGFVCMVDPFAPRNGENIAARCARRQEAYALALHSGPIYTPQMIVGGVADVVGYRREDIAQSLDSALAPMRISVNAGAGIGADSGGTRIEMTLPVVSDPEGVSFALEAVFFHKNAEARENGNRGKRSISHLVSGIVPLGFWNGEGGARILEIPEKDAGGSWDKNRGVTVLAVDPATHRIVAAGESIFGATSP